MFFALRASEARAAEDGLAPSDEAALAREAVEATILRLALARNPEVLELDERARAADAHAEAAGGLDDPQLKSELWGVPLAHPVSLDRAETIMLGLRQTFPPLGTRDARARIAHEDAGSIDEALRARQQEIATQVRQAYAQYWRSEHEVRIHLEHVDLLSHVVEISRDGYKTGRGSQQDLLRLEVELSQLHADVASLEQERRSSRAQLNMLMGRAPDAALGPAPERDLETADVADRPEADAPRPELALALRAVRRGEATLELARRSARWPSLMVGADYWYMPTLGEPHAYGAMLAIDLPWLNPRHGAEIREAQHALAADREALAARRNASLYAALDARAHVDAARAALRILDDDLLPQARRSYESAEAAYRSGQGGALGLLEAMRAYLQVRLERSRAMTRLAMSQADDARARGVAVPASATGARP